MFNNSLLSFVIAFTAAAIVVESPDEVTAEAPEGARDESASREPALSAG